MRLFFKILLFLVVIIIIVLLVSIQNVDYTPYFASDYYQSTKARLESDSGNIKLSKGPLQVGLSRVNITPVGIPELGGSTSAVPMAGYGNREGKPAQGVHDSLFVKAVVLQVQDARLVLLAADMLIIPPTVVEAVQAILSQRTGISRGQLFYVATHTHSSLGGWSSRFVGEAFAGAPNPAIVQWLAGQFAAAVEKAIADLQPGQIGFGSFEAPDLVKNRLVGDLGKEQATCSFLVANQYRGKKAIVGIFDAHATTLSGNNWQFSADYPGYWYKKLEAAGIDLPVFCAGSVGSHGPESKGKDFEKSQYLGEALADSVLKYSVLTDLRDTISLAVINLKMDLPPFQVRITDSRRLAPFLTKKLFPPVGEVFIQSARIGDFIWTTTPADFSGESALNHQNSLYKNGFASTITSFNGAYIGYVLPAKYYHFNEYESRVMSWFGPNMGPYLDEMIFRMNDVLTELE